MNDKLENRLSRLVIVAGQALSEAVSYQAQSQVNLESLVISIMNIPELVIRIKDILIDEEFVPPIETLVIPDEALTNLRDLLNNSPKVYLKFVDDPGDSNPPGLTAAPGYEQLVQVFAAAHDQAAYGKGKERHANGLPFHEQRMQGISDLVGSPDGMVYQLVKKTTEGLQFDSPGKREHELLGALNYLAGVVIWLRRHEAAKPVEG